MLSGKPILSALLAGAGLFSAQLAFAAEPPAAPAVKGPLLYLQCDGNPNNMAAGETVARFIGAVTLLALFAPSPEAPDASKRKFGAEGVEACDGIIQGDKAEHNVVRRIPLILARALHHIEAKDYDGAVADVAIARQEAQAAGLIGNPYFDRSTGLSLDLIESQALLRAGKVEEARVINIRSAQYYPFSYYPQLVVRGMQSYSTVPITKDEEANLENLSRISPSVTFLLSGLLDEAGRFGESVSALKSLDDFQTAAYHDKNSDPTKLLIGTNMAISAALAGSWEEAEAVNAKDNALLQDMRSAGKEIANESLLIERMDFYNIVKLAHDGKMVDARRQFAARSRWVAPTFGQVIELNRRLRHDAAKEEMFGSLADDADTLIDRRKQESFARMMEKDKDNKTLFTFILPYASVSDYQRLSSRVWNTKGNKIIAKEKRKDSEVYLLSIFDADPMVPPDALILHAALQAKARGKTGMVFRLIPDDPRIAFVYFADRGEAGMSDGQYLDADAVIADLRKVIPSPEELKAREAAKLKSAT